MSSMNVVRMDAYGSVDVLAYSQMPRPAAGDGEVLIRVAAASVNPFDCAVRAGYLAGWYAYAFPLILGLDVSGVVENVGAGVANFAPGDAVYARADPSRNGAYAEYIAVGATEVARKPKALSHVQAAAIPHAALTAWRSLFDAAGLARGQSVLIHGAAGGVGTFAVQLAKWRGAYVIGTASPRNQDHLRQLGVDEAIDYIASRFEDRAREVDVVLDTIGGETQQRSWPALRKGGILVSVVQQPSQETADSFGVRQQFVTASPPAGKTLAEIAALVDDGHVKAVIADTLPLRDVRRAHEMVEGKHTRGKVVLQVSE